MGIALETRHSRLRTGNTKSHPNLFRDPCLKSVDRPSFPNPPARLTCASPPLCLAWYVRSRLPRSRLPSRLPRSRLPRRRSPRRAPQMRRIKKVRHTCAHGHGAPEQQLTLRLFSNQKSSTRDWRTPAWMRRSSLRTPHRSRMHERVRALAQRVRSKSCRAFHVRRKRVR
jgi:hypothetical protein